MARAAVDSFSVNRPHRAVYRWSRGPLLLARQAWLLVCRARALLLVATGDRGLLCVGLTAPTPPQNWEHSLHYAPSPPAVETDGPRESQ